MIENKIPGYVRRAINAATGNIIHCRRAQAWLVQNFPGNPFEASRICGYWIAINGRTGLFEIVW